MAVTVLVLQPLTIERGPPGSGSQQEAASLLIARQPSHVTDPLETEHGIENIKWDHWQVMRTVTSCRRHPGRHSPGFVDALLQNLP